MAIVEFSIKDLEKLVGKKLTRSDMEDRIPMMGCPLEKMDNESVWYEVFPNRPDMLSIEGFARAVKTFFGLSKGLSLYKTKPSGIYLSVDPSVKDVRPYVTAAVIRNVRLTDDAVASLMQVQEKIHETLGRKRSKVAIGVHDLDRVTPPFTYTTVIPEEVEFTPLGMSKSMNLREIGKEHPKGIEYIRILEGKKRWPIIFDKNNEVLSFPPIINGELTKVTEHTKNLFIDITGTSGSAINQAINIITTSLYDRGFSIETVNVHGKDTPNLEPQRMSINIAYVNKLLDLDLTNDEILDALGKMGYGFQGNTILIPAYRVDVMHEIDIVEDVAIAYGYEKFDPRIPKVPTISKRLGINNFCLFLKEIIIGLGFQEVITMVLTNKESEFRKMNADASDVCEVLNPVSTECSICRKGILPSLMRVLWQNKNREYPQKIFEIGDAVVPDDSSETGGVVRKKLALVISNSTVNYEEISSVAGSFFSSLGIIVKIKETAHPSFIKGRVGDILYNNKKIGIIGEIHPSVLENFGLKNPVLAMEIDIQGMYESDTI